MLKLLIAVDGSPHARRAVEAVARLASLGVPLEVHLVNVREPFVFYGEVPIYNADEIEAVQQAAQAQLLASAQSDALALALPVRSVKGVLGQPAGEIVRVAHELGADQIVMGTHGRGAVGSLFLGSVAQRVAHLTRVPLLLVK